MRNFLLLIFSAIAFLLAARVTAEPAPEWLRNAETYAVNYSKWTDEKYEEMRTFPFVISGAQTDIERLHKMGVRVLVYVTFYQMPPGREYQRADVGKHEDWAMVQENGDKMLSAFATNPPPDCNPGWLAVCRNSPDFRKYAIEYTRWVMQQGADGIFVDNVINDKRVCYGPKFGKHQHLSPDDNYAAINAEFYRAIRAEVKKFGKDKALVLNCTSHFPEWVAVSDGQMVESYVCSWDKNHVRHGDMALLGYQKDLGPAEKSGCTILALSYPGHGKFTAREDAFYSFAWARFSDFAWTDRFNDDKFCSSLYKLRLGRPTGPMEKHDNYFTREFENGVVVASSDSQGAYVEISAASHPSLYDVFEAKRIKPDASGKYQFHLEPGLGRVFLFE